MSTRGDPAAVRNTRRQTEGWQRRPMAERRGARTPICAEAAPACGGCVRAAMFHASSYAWTVSIAKLFTRNRNLRASIAASPRTGITFAGDNTQIRHRPEPFSSRGSTAPRLPPVEQAAIRSHRPVRTPSSMAACPISGCAHSPAPIMNIAGQPRASSPSAS